MTGLTIEREDDTLDVSLDESEQRVFDSLSVSREPDVALGGYAVPNAPPRRVTPATRRVQFSDRRRPPAPVEEPEPELDAFVNHAKRAPVAPLFDDDDDDEGFDDDEPLFEDEGGYAQPANEFNPVPGANTPSGDYVSVEDEKADLLGKLERMRKKGLSVSQRLNNQSSLADLRTEFKRIRNSIDVEQSIKFSRRTLVACVTGLEFLNKRYNPFDLQLEGWSETIMENQGDYDDVFEELYVKYKSSVDVSPEIKLIMMLGGSATMFHLTNSMFKAAIPNMNDVLKQNPDLVQSMMGAVQNTVASRVSPASAPVAGGRPEMKGPSFDMSSFMGGAMPAMPPMPVSTTVDARQQPEGVTVDDLQAMADDADDMSDIVSVVSSEDTRSVAVSEGGTARRRTRKSGGGGGDKKEISF